MMFCEKCGSECSLTDRFCGQCGCPLSGGQDDSLADMAKTAKQRFREFIGIKGFNRKYLKGFFSDVFSHHERAEIEDALVVGTRDTTPGIDSVATVWPRPWIFARCFGATAVLYVLLAMTYAMSENPVLIPSILLVGTVVAPLAVLVLFFELNVWKDIPLVGLVRYVAVGGVISILVTSVLDALCGIGLSWLSVASAGIVEEPSKLITVIVMARGRDIKHILGALLVGAAVGCGFAIVESLGYGFLALVPDEVEVSPMAGMHGCILFRGFCSPFMHILWTAVASAALWRIQRSLHFSGSACLNKAFLRLFCVPVALHMIWNANLESAEFLGIFAIGIAVAVAVVGWWVLLALVQEGLGDVARMKRDASISNVLAVDDHSAGGCVARSAES